MDMRVERQVELAIGRGGVIRRRDFCAVCRPRPWPPDRSPGATWWPWRPAELRRQGKACILLWMQGGPSQFETFSPKPGHPNGGTTKAITTTVPGIEVSENFPRVAQQAKHLAIIRSMTSKEGSHPRATYLLHTGYLPTASVKYPAFGSIAAKELEQANFDLPSFVRIGNVQNGSSGGLLGSHFDPFVMPVAGKDAGQQQADDCRCAVRSPLGFAFAVGVGLCGSGAARSGRPSKAVWSGAADDPQSEDGRF